LIVMGQVQALKITTLVENLVQAGGLGQWGLSFLLELIDSKGEKRKVVFDTGSNKEAFLHNVKFLKVDLRDVDCVVISHGHGDHTAATVEVVEAAGGVKVYGHPHTFLSRFSENKEGKRRRGGPLEGQGLEDIEKAGGDVVLSADPMEIVQGVWTTGQVERLMSFERISPPSTGGKSIIIVDGEEIDDQILDDQALWIINTLLQAQRLGRFNQINGLVGGTHLVRRSDEYIEQTVKELKQFGLGLISPCHCTGFKATTRLWQAFPDEFVLNFCGRIIEAGKEPERRVI